MIEHVTIDGRPALVAYLTFDFKPATRLTADLCKITFADGDVQWMAMEEPLPKEANDDDA